MMQLEVWRWVFLLSVFACSMSIQMIPSGLRLHNSNSHSGMETVTIVAAKVAEKKRIIVAEEKRIKKWADAIKQSQFFRKQPRHHEHIDDAARMISRLPTALKHSSKEGIEAFISSCSFMVPFAIFWNIRSIKTPKVLVKKALAQSLDWAKYSGLYIGGDTFMATLRDKDDRYNSYFGSGITSAIVRIEEGPLGALQGFAVGYGFMYAIDQVMKGVPSPEGAAGAFPASSGRQNQKTNSKTQGGAGAGGKKIVGVVKNAGTAGPVRR